MATAVSTTPTTLDSGTAYELFVLNSGAVNVIVTVGALQQKRLRPGQSANYFTGGQAVTAVTESGSGQVDVTTSTNPEAGGGGGGGSAAYQPVDHRWSAGLAVKTGQIIENAGTMYRATADFTTPGTFNTTNLTAVGGGGGGGTAATTTFTPTGSIAATDVQAALAEVDSEKIPLTQKGSASGVASLGSDGLVPAAQLPATTAGVLGYISVKAAPYNAKGDARSVYDAACTSGSNVITSATAAFSSSDVGKAVSLTAGVGLINQVGTVTAVSSATQITVSFNASFTGASNAGLHLGTDDTAAIQSAINAAVTAGGATVYFPRGMYMVAGAQQSGSVTGTGNSVGTTFTYSGQILYPAVTNAASMVPVRLLGETPVAGNSIQPLINGAPPTGGSIIVSLATSGSVFDTIPQSSSLLNMATIRSSNIHLQYEAIGVRALASNGLTALNLSAAMSATLRQVRVDVLTNSATGNGSSKTSTAIWGPPKGNFAICHFTDVEVLGYGTGMRISEHYQIDGNSIIQSCNIAVQLDTADHLNTVSNLCVQHSTTALYPTGKTFLVGTMTIEPGGTSFLLADDNNGYLSGDLTVNAGAQSPNASLPINGGYALNYRLLNRVTGEYPPVRQTGWFGQPVKEDFARVLPSTTALHATSMSCHPWEAGDLTPVIGVASGKATPTSSYGTVYCAAPPTQRVYLRSRIQLSSGSSSIGIVPRAASDGGSKKNWFAVYLRINGATNEIGMYTGNVTGPTYAQGAVLSGAGLVAGTTYELSVLWDQPIKNGPATVTAYLDGVQKLQYTLTSAEQIRYGSPSRVGLSLDPVGTEDMGSRWLDFYALPA